MSADVVIPGFGKVTGATTALRERAQSAQSTLVACDHLEQTYERDLKVIDDEIERLRIKRDDLVRARQQVPEMRARALRDLDIVKKSVAALTDRGETRRPSTQRSVETKLEKLHRLRRELAELQAEVETEART